MCVRFGRKLSIRPDFSEVSWIKGWSSLEIMRIWSFLVCDLLYFSTVWEVILLFNTMFSEFDVYNALVNFPYFTDIFG